MSNRFTHLNYQQNGVSGYDSNEVGYQLNNTRQTNQTMRTFMILIIIFLMVNYQFCWYDRS